MRINSKNKQNKAKAIKRIVFNIIKYIIFICILILILYSLIFNFNKIFFKKEYLQIGNISIITGNSFNSMKPELQNSDLIIIGKEKEYDMQEGNIYAYKLNEKIFVQRLYYIDTNNGNIQYIFKGDNNINPNIEGVKSEDIIGKVIFSVPIIGLFAKVFQNGFVCLFIIISIIYVVIYKVLKNKRNLNKKG